MRLGFLLGNGRTIRAILAILVIVVLAILFVQQRAQETRDRERTMHTVSASAWKVSELVFETLRFSNALRLHSSGEITRSEVQLKFELLWSRVDILSQDPVGSAARIGGVLEAFRAILAANEEIVLDKPLIAPRAALSMAAELSDTAAALRAVWIKTFQARSFADLALSETGIHDNTGLQYMIVGLMGVMVIYVVIEIVFAGVSQKREERLHLAAAQASEAKTRFLANVSHEIRTPLNGILGMACELSEFRLGREQMDCVDVIRQSGEVLLHTLNDILDLSKIEAGAMAIETRPFNLRETVTSAHALYQAAARDKGFRFEMAFAPGVPEHVEGDSVRLRQVLHNLISNAIKFTAEGGVRVSVTPCPETGRIRLSVLDSGPGIAADTRNNIFRPFTQADASITRKHGGTGLGLAISSQLVSAMGGRLELTSQPGQGAEFWFELDLPEAAAEARPEVGAVKTSGCSLDGLRVLVVDDNSTNRLILKRFLKGALGGIEEASDGACAVDFAERTRFDVILMDIQMPVLDGIGATRRIRALEIERNHPPCHIIAVTANVMEHQKQEYLDQGMDDVIGKPVSKKDLFARLSLVGARKIAEMQTA